MQRIPNPLARDVAPNLPHVFGLEGEETGCVHDIKASELASHALAYAKNVIKGHLQQRPQHHVRMPDRNAVRLVLLARNLGQLAIGSKADGTGDDGADALSQVTLDVLGQPQRISNAPAIQLAGQLVNRLHRINGKNSLDLTQQRIVGPAVEVRLLRHQDDIWAAVDRLIDRHHVLHTERLGFS